jgi:hypothetical protein
LALISVVHAKTGTSFAILGGRFSPILH